MPAADNPFLHQVYLGEFSGPCWPWLEQPVSTSTVRLDFVHAGMDRALASLAEDACDLVHLSNILDWIKPEEARQMLNSACQCLAPGGLVVIRQLNSRLDIRQIPPVAEKPYGFESDFEDGSGDVLLEYFKWLAEEST